MTQLSNFKDHRPLRSDPPEGDRLQDGPDQVALCGGGFQAHEGGTGFGVI